MKGGKGKKDEKNKLGRGILKKKVIAGTFLFLIILLPLILTGCWNNRDLTDINIVVGLGIDRTEEGKILMTVQVVEPAAIQFGSSSNEKRGGSQQKPVYVVSYEGDTVLGTIRSALAVMDKEMFFSTVQILILGERLLQDGIEEVLDLFMRDNEFDYGMDILAAKGATPEEILEIQTDADSIPAVYIKGTVDNYKSRGTVRKTMLIDLIKEIEDKGIEPAIGQITVGGEKVVSTEGVAVIRDGKLAGWLDPHETRGYLFATNKVKSAIVNVPDVNMSKGETVSDRKTGKIAVEIIRSKGKVDVVFQNDEPLFLKVKVEVEANVGGYEGGGNLETPDNLQRIEQNLEEEIKKEIKAALKKCQEVYASDIFGFGVQVRKYHKQYWKKVKNDWNNIFSRLPLDIEVNATLLRTGNIKGPLKKDE